MKDTYSISVFKGEEELGGAWGVEGSDPFDAVWQWAGMMSVQDVDDLFEGATRLVVELEPVVVEE
jgi:hypothetical protein